MLQFKNFLQLYSAEHEPTTQWTQWSSLSSVSNRLAAANSIIEMTYFVSSGRVGR